MSAGWYYRIMGEEYGPVSAQQLMATARFGRLTRDDVVRQGIDGDWNRAEMVNGLFGMVPRFLSPSSPSIASHSLQPPSTKRLKKTA
jgi:hypothetical protein